MKIRTEIMRRTVVAYTLCDEKYFSDIGGFFLAELALGFLPAQFFNGDPHKSVYGDLVVRRCVILCLMDELYYYHSWLD